MPPTLDFKCSSKSRGEQHRLEISGASHWALLLSSLTLVLGMGITVPRLCPHGRRPIRRYRVALKNACIVTLTLGALAGCTNPYALKIAELNYSAKQKSGVIQFSDPKLFPREHLINERRDELGFLFTQLGECKDIEIVPEIIRELEVVQAIAAGAGLKFDPAAALNFKSNAEIAELKNDIARVRLEMQLLQLQRDAQLLLQQLEAQQTPNYTPPPPAEIGDVIKVPDTGLDLSKTEIETLLGAAKQLINDLQTDARATTTELEAKSGMAGPIDTFNHRMACRATVKNVINQIQLDELHDLDGNALVRIQTRATVLPAGVGYHDTLGVLRMEVVPPQHTEKDWAEVYHNWLGYVNRNINTLSLFDPPLRINTNSRFLPLSGYFQLKLLEFPRLDSDGKLLNGTANYCSGLQQTERMPNSCWYVRVALPSGTTNNTDKFDQAARPLIAQLRGAAQEISEAKARDYSMGENCAIEQLDNAIRLRRTDSTELLGKTAQEAMYSAQGIRQIWLIALANYVALLDSFKDTGSAHKLLNDLRQYLDRLTLAQLINAANEFVGVVASKNERCRAKLFEQALESPPEAFVNALETTTNRVAIYDVAPAERVQPVSTAARAAEAVSLAASIAGTLPTYGLGTSGNFAFTRSAVGKADALELAPIVVGFAEPVTKAKDSTEERLAAFGWLLGPKAVLKPSEQKLVFIHPVKPYELHADLSLPGWWREFTLRAYTAWAPNWRSTDTNGNQTSKTMVTTGETLVRDVTVPMRRNSGDMAGLTTLLLKASQATALLGIPRIVEVEPSEISPCDKTVHFQIWGDNVWRASMVHLGGHLLENRATEDPSAATTIKVLPDMRGIVIDVDISKLPIRRGKEATLTVWTPDGRDTEQISFVERLTGTNCLPHEETDLESNSGVPAITELVPYRVSACASNVEFTIYGENLTEGSMINVGGVAASGVNVLPSKKGLNFNVDINTISKSYDQSTVVTLSTANGDDRTRLYFADVRDDTNKCEKPSRNPVIESITPEKFNYCQPTISLTVKGRNLGNPVEARLNGVDAKSLNELEPKDGTLARINVDLVPARPFLKNVEKAKVEFRTEHGLASTDLTIVGSKSDCI